MLPPSPDLEQHLARLGRNAAAPPELTLSFVVTLEDPTRFPKSLMITGERR